MISLFTFRKRVPRAALLALLLSASSVHAEETAIQRPQVDIRNLAFQPNVLTVKAGTEVTFINHDAMLHSVVAKEAQIDSGVLEKDETFAVSFTVPGEYAYVCGVHGRMTGKIIVEP